MITIEVPLTEGTVIQIDHLYVVEVVIMLEHNFLIRLENTR